MRIFTGAIWLFAFEIFAMKLLAWLFGVELGVIHGIVFGGSFSVIVLNPWLKKEFELMEEGGE